MWCWTFIDTSSNFSVNHLHKIIKICFQLCLILFLLNILILYSSLILTQINYYFSNLNHSTNIWFFWMLLARLNGLWRKIFRDIKFDQEGKVIAHWLRKKPVLECLQKTENYSRYEQIHRWLIPEAHLEMYLLMLAAFSKSLTTILKFVKRSKLQIISLCAHRSLNGQQNVRISRAALKLPV